MCPFLLKTCRPFQCSSVQICTYLECSLNMRYWFESLHWLNLLHILFTRLPYISICIATILAWISNFCNESSRLRIQNQIKFLNREDHPNINEKLWDAITNKLTIWIEISNQLDWNKTSVFQILCFYISTQNDYPNHQVGSLIMTESTNLNRTYKNKQHTMI